MHSFRHRTLSLLLVLGSFISMASAAPDTDPDDAVRVASGLSRIGVLDKESKSRFIERVTPEYRRLAATEVMAQMLAGDAWQSMTPAQRTELAGLYEKVVLGALYAAIAAAAPAQPGMTGGKCTEADRS